jgi:hypothetical protein
LCWILSVTWPNATLIKPGFGRQADEDLSTGNYEDFDTMDDFIATLKVELAAA